MVFLARSPIPVYQYPSTAACDYCGLHLTCSKVSPKHDGYNQSTPSDLQPRLGARWSRLFGGHFGPAFACVSDLEKQRCQLGTSSICLYDDPTTVESGATD
ncbi:hypothetical protein COCCADRAFT_457 [Bipolaris zeicola 26-R-13]|uniref:Uncharacterized protein n=1 Tax=Cochliobolus carbonum (strain 26-R-13) TaxID=930089 RepID=W6YMK3_COCC2|nr:uncharacterized protein COCCADRAFT_457 [Bipolaris zeicola 26-R-13]EUC39055.1 hypothetical protein COCCADRAFT_457 [Bipolaris zeicola 26-R-13]